MTSTSVPVLRDLPDAELAAMYGTADDGTCRALVAEMNRRDRADRARARRAAIRSEWADMTMALYLQAEAECRGNLVSRAGATAGVADGFALWSGRRSVAMKYATPELIEFWEKHGRVTATEYAAAVALASRNARDDSASEITEDTATTEVTEDEQHEEHAEVASIDGRGGLGADDAGTVRRGRRAGAGQPVRGLARHGRPGPAGRAVRRGHGGLNDAYTGARGRRNLDRSRPPRRQHRARGTASVGRYTDRAPRVAGYL
jgi:hypothetical protein